MWRTIAERLSRWSENLANHNPINAGSSLVGYQTYLLVMLFLYYFSAVRDAALVSYQRRYPQDRERVDRRLRRERFIVPAGYDFAAIVAQRQSPQLGQFINTALAEWERANPEKLMGLFRDLDFNSTADWGDAPQRRLLPLIEILMDPALMLLPGATNPVTTPSATPIAAISNYLLQCLATHKSLGEKVTPPEIGQLLAALLPPTPGQRIYDPACGLGSLLLALAGVVNSRNFALYGQEQDFRFQTLCRLNMIFHGCDSARIEGGNSLLQPKFVVADQLKKFDLVVSNPGFSREAWGADNAAEDRFRRFYRGVPPPTRADYAIISHMLATLSDPGRMAVVVPHGALFRGGAESKIRQTLIAENLLDAVIGLPAHLCYHSPIPVVVLLFKRGRLHSNVLFIDASRDFAHDKPQHRLRTRDISRIVKTYQEFQTVAGYACRATVAQIQENDCNLSISRYVAADTSLPTLDLASLQQEIAILEAELASVCAEIDQCGQALAQARVTR